MLVDDNTAKDNVLGDSLMVSVHLLGVVFDSGYKYMYDRYNDVYRSVPLNGDMAGLAQEQT